MAFSGITLAEAVYNNAAEAKDELSFRKGDIVTVIEKNYGADGWWLCQINNRQGIVPYNYVRELTEEEIIGMLPAPPAEQTTRSHYQTPSDRNFQVEYNRFKTALSQGVDPPVPAPQEEMVQPQPQLNDPGAMDNLYVAPTSNRLLGDGGLHPDPSSCATTHSSSIKYIAVGDEEVGPSMTLVAGQKLLQRVNTVLDSSTAQCSRAIGPDISQLEGEQLLRASRSAVDAGREAHTLLKDLITLSCGVLRVARQLQKAGHAPHLVQQLVRPIVPIKDSHVELAAAVAELDKCPDVLTARQLLAKVQSLLTSVRVHVDELRGYVLSNAVLLFLPAQTVDNPDYEELPDPQTARTPQHSPHPLKSRDSPDGSANTHHHHHHSNSDLLERQEHSPSLMHHPPQDNRHASDLVGHDTIIAPSHKRSGSRESVDSDNSRASRHSSSSSNDVVPTLRRKADDDRPVAHVLAGMQVAVGDLSDGELSLLAYYAERMETLIPSVTNAVEAFCRAIGEKQVPKQFVWHSKMVVVGAYKMVYVADTVFQKLSHSELRNHIVACSNRLVDSIKNIVEYTKVAAQQYPSIGAMRDMVESVAHLPPLALDLAESIKEAASLR
ncbi:breast cancer anti-estrogen resistance protein 1-like isoform X2 [Sycon ciliatum]|uniref:breast cancer anti-estrogen resistance protein 1-like isoform X2 n=1 Tax=Sycon ciliatum TaxID=27933 RepID=UPI0020A9984B|eukprot:scpid38974/ scgid29301/ Breast cancer anti-estrogen resistance protein 1; CRK-associated substrate; Cas scaffolding protein family member 1; p130cas